MLKQLYKTLVSKNNAIEKKSHTRIIRHQSHSISKNKISSHALDVALSLQEAGYDAYIVGGAVRDLLLKKKPKDFDIATNATPEQIKAHFKRARIIGRRFRIVHVRCGREIIEVTTFRGNHDTTFKSKSSIINTKGMLIRDNVYGTLHDDALRRDFTINALYFNAQDLTIIDHLNAIEDLKKRKLKIIGNPINRYKEDPVRMLRAIRLNIKLGFSIDNDTAKPIKDLSPLIKQVSNARLYDEVLKLFLHGYGKDTFVSLRKFNIFKQLFPQTEEILKKNTDQSKKYMLLITNSLSNTDDRIKKNKPITPAFLFAVLLWPVLDSFKKELNNKNFKKNILFKDEVQNIINEQLKTVAIPKRFIPSMKDIWYLQKKLENFSTKKSLQTINHPRFRAAYDFFILRSGIDINLKEKSSHWTDLQKNSPKKYPKNNRVIYEQS